MLSAEPARIELWPDVCILPPANPVNELRHTDAQWAEATLRHRLVTELAESTDRSATRINDVAKELGVKRRRIFSLLKILQKSGNDVAAFLPQQGNPRAKRILPSTEAIIAQAVDQHYAQPSRPNLSSLHRRVCDLCAAAGVPNPSQRALKSRVRTRDQAWLTRRREGPKAARALRLLTGAHPGASSPWERVQIDSTPCDILLVRETDRTVIGRPNFTVAIDIYSRVVPGFSVALESASTLTVATCLAHACLPKTDWLEKRDLGSVHWPVYGKPKTLEYDQGPENEAKGIQRGLRRHGIASKVRAKGHPEQHGTIERLIGTMMRIVHELRGATFSNTNERGESEPEKRACLTLPELERVLALAIDSYNHTTHDGIGERPMDKYLAWYRRPGLSDADRLPPRLPANRLLLDFLPYELRPLKRAGIRLFRIDYSCVDLLPLWKRDNQSAVQRVIAYDPRSLAQVWLLDEATDFYIVVPTRACRPDLTLAQSEEARRELKNSKAEDRNEERLFENLAKIKSIEAEALTATTRRRAERSVQASKATRLKGVPTKDSGLTEIDSPDVALVPNPTWGDSAIVPFADVERL
jgi:putative transposase